MKSKKIIVLSIIITLNLLFVQFVTNIEAQQKKLSLGKNSTLDIDPCNIIRDVYNELSVKIQGLRQDGYPILADLLTGLQGILGLAVKICDILDGGTFRASSTCPLCAPA